jgi:hypothetical protein
MAATPDPSSSQPSFIQTDPPSIPISVKYSDGHYPLGQVVEYHEDYYNRKTVSREELKSKEVQHEQHYEELRQAAEVHRQVPSG